MIALSRSLRGLALRRALSAWSHRLDWSCARAHGETWLACGQLSDPARLDKREPSPSPPAEGALTVASVELSRHP